MLFWVKDVTVTWKAEWSTLWHLAAMESEDHGDSPLTPHHWVEVGCHEQGQNIRVFSVEVTSVDEVHNFPQGVHGHIANFVGSGFAFDKTLGEEAFEAFRPRS